MGVSRTDLAKLRVLCGLVLSVSVCARAFHCRSSLHPRLRALTPCSVLSSILCLSQVAPRGLRDGQRQVPLQHQHVGTHLRTGRPLLRWQVGTHAAALPKVRGR